MKKRQREKRQYEEHKQNNFTSDKDFITSEGNSKKWKAIKMLMTKQKEMRRNALNSSDLKQHNKDIS